MACRLASMLVTTFDRSKLVLPTMTPAALLTTCCATSNTAMTIFQVLVTINTAAKVLKIHLKNMKVSKSWKLFLSMII